MLLLYNYKSYQACTLKAFKCRAHVANSCVQEDKLSIGSWLGILKKAIFQIVALGAILTLQNTTAALDYTL